MVTGVWSYLHDKDYHLLGRLESGICSTVGSPAEKQFYLAPVCVQSGLFIAPLFNFNFHMFPPPCYAHFDGVEAC